MRLLWFFLFFWDLSSNFILIYINLVFVISNLTFRLWYQRYFHIWEGRRSNIYNNKFLSVFGDFIWQIISCLLIVIFFEFWLNLKYWIWQIIIYYGDNILYWPINLIAEMQKWSKNLHTYITFLAFWVRNLLIRYNFDNVFKGSQMIFEKLMPS